MQAADVALAHYRRQKMIAARVARDLARLWVSIDRSNIAHSWAALVPSATATVAGGQLLAAQDASSYTADVLAAQGVDVAAEGRLIPSAFAGVASDGRPLETLLYQPVISALTTIGQGASPARALAAGRLHLDLLARTQVADAGRVADGVALAATPQATGYVRLLSPPSCSRCVILAGKHYRWNAGFQRHPRCDCRHIPVREDVADDLRTDPKAYFSSLSREEQDRVFTQSGAQAIRDGADISQVVNARRGARGLAPAGARLTRNEVRMLRGGRERGHLETANVFGRDLFITTEGVTTRGLAGVRLGARETGDKAAGARYRSARRVRLMPESIYQIAGSDREEAVRLLRLYGYIL